MRGGVVVVGVGVHVPLRGLVGSLSTARTRGDPMNRDSVQGHIQGTREQTQDRVFITTEVDEREDVARTQDEGNDGTDQGTLGNLTELHLGGTLKDRGGGHQGANEEHGQPARDEDVVEDESDGGQGFQTDITFILFVQDRDVVEDHEDQNHGVRGQQQNIDLVQL